MATQAQRTQAELDKMFSHMLVSKPNPNEFMGTAYTIGTFAHCARFALMKGIRATTIIIPS